MAGRFTSTTVDKQLHDFSERPEVMSSEHYGGEIEQLDTKRLLTALWPEAPIRQFKEKWPNYYHI